MEHADVVIAGSGFAGAVTAWRLAELYRAADADPASVVVLERGERLGHTDFRQSMHVDELSRVYRLTQGQGMQVVTGNLVGGGSNLYLAASLRAPTETFERRDHHPGDGEDRRMWPAAISRATLDPYYARAEAALRVRRPTWAQVSKSGGLWAATLHAAGHTCDRVPLAIDPHRCVDAKWCHTGCIFGAKNSVITNYLWAAEDAGVRVRPLLEVQAVRQTSARPYRYVVSANRIDPVTRAPVGVVEIACKVCVLATGAMGDGPLLMRSQPGLPALSEHVGRHLGSNGDHVAAIEFDESRVRDVLRLPGYHEFHKGRPITTMTYDFFAGRRSNVYDGTRFTIQEIFLSPLTNLLYDDGRDPEGDPSWWGVQKKHAISNWSRRIELLAMVEDTSDGTFLTPSPTGGGAVQTGAGPIAFGTFTYAMSDQSIRVREAADAAMRRIAGTGGLGRFMRLTETQGAYCAHPLGGCRMADSADLGVVDDRGEVFGYEGLYCSGSSVIPTSLAVNPSLTVTAVAERIADGLVSRAGDLGLPAAPAALRPATPASHVGPAVKPRRVPGGAARRHPKRRTAAHE
jgi:choline dehydrogenase-like flavoprotein